MSIELAPGVRTFEHPSGQTVARGAVASRLLAVGMARKGPINTPVAVRSFKQYVDHFGDDLTYGELGVQMRQAFDAGLGDGVVVRTANGYGQATVTLSDEFGHDTLALEAVDAGEMGNAIRAAVDYATADPELTFNLILWRETVDDQGRVGRAENESFANLSMDPQAANFVERMVNGVSKLVSVRAVHGTQPDLTLEHHDEVFSQSGLYFADGAALDTMLSGITTEQRLTVEINGRDRVTVILTPPIDLGSIRDAINAALTARSLSSRVDVVAHSVGIGTLVALRIEVTSADGTRSIRILPAGQNDGTGTLALGSRQGGIEVGLYSAQRPAMTGLSTRPFSAPGTIDNLEQLLGVGAPPWTVAFDDGTTDGAVSGLNWPVPTPAPTSPMDDGDGGTPPSLADLEANLDNLVAALNAASPLGDVWTFRRIGARLLATRNDGRVTPAEAAQFTTSGTAVPYLNNAEALRPSEPLAGGLDGNAPQLPDYRDAFRQVSRNVDIFNMMILPRGAGQSDDDRALIWGAASAFCRDHNALLIMDPKSDNHAWSTVDEVVQPAQLTAFKSGIVAENTCCYYPRLQVAIGRNRAYVDPSGTMAGVIASTISRLGVWYAAAGLSASLTGVTGLEHPMSDSDNGVINPRGINALRAKSTGNVSWGVRTFAGDDTFSNRDFAYIPVRMTTDFIKNSLSAALQGYVFQPNNYITWANIELMCRSFMHSLYVKKAFSGEKVEDAYDVRCDDTTTSPTDIALGILNVWVFFAPLRPAEFIEIHVQQMLATQRK